MNLEPGRVSAAPEAAAGAASEMALAPVATPAPARPRSARRRRLWRACWEFLHDLSVAVLFCFFLITFVAQAFRVQGTSMEPLLEDGERIVVNKFVYRFRPIERGDVVVFWYPRDPSVSFIKRVVGLPGDTVEIRSGRLYVNGVAVSERYLPPSFRDSDSLPPTRGPPGLLLRPRRPPSQQQRQPELGRGARALHLRPGGLPLLARGPAGPIR